MGVYVCLCLCVHAHAYMRAVVSVHVRDLVLTVGIKGKSVPPARKVTAVTQSCICYASHYIVFHIPVPPHIFLQALFHVGW